ncbi:MAG: S8 family serine peptidase, partial [Proteobacteria bacterium]|nr:S8 family serine peptidase [Pseudomonadota bacterium]
MLHESARFTPSASPSIAADHEAIMLLSRSLVALPLCCALSAAPVLAAQPDLASRFEARWYSVQGRPVVVMAAADRLALRTVQALPAHEVARLVERSLFEVLDRELDGGSRVPTLLEPARVLRRDGLYELELDRALSPNQRLVLAQRLVADPRVLQVYPVLSRLGHRAYADDHLVVSAAPGQLDAVLDVVLPKIAGSLERRSRVHDTALVRVGAAFAFDAVEASRALSQANIPGLRAAEPDLYRRLVPTAVVNDPMYGQQWHLSHTDTSVPGSGEIHVTGAWDVTKGDPSVVVAVFDTGVDLQHEDLTPNFVPGFDAADDDENPSAECSASYDGRQESATCPASEPYRESHSTSVCGTAAGRGDNSQGTSGVCPLCSILPVRLLGGSDMLSGLSTAEAFIRAVDDGAWVINNSWG